MKGLAAIAGREKQLRIFALPAWNQQHLFSHSYNMLHVRPRRPGDAGGDPVATAERVFSVLPLGDPEYYNVQGQRIFTNICRLLHGMVDERGHGLPFTLRDALQRSPEVTHLSSRKVTQARIPIARADLRG